VLTYSNGIAKERKTGEIRVLKKPDHEAKDASGGTIVTTEQGKEASTPTKGVKYVK